MTFTVSIKSDKRCFLAGDGFTLTATVAGDEPLPSNLTYTWTKDDQPHENSTATLTVADATSENAGSYKVTVQDTDTMTSVESEVFLIEEAELIVNITEPQHFYVSSQTNVELHATVKFSGGKTPSDNYELHYSWSKGDGVIDTKKDITIQEFTADKNGVYTVKVWGESEDSAASASTKIMLATMNVDQDVVESKTVALGNEILLNYVVSENIVGDSSGMPNLTIKYNWYLQREGQIPPTLIGSEVGEALEGFSITPDGHLFKESATYDDTAKFWCVAKLYQQIEDETVEVATSTSRKCSMEVVKMFRYVHPIPWRKTSFIYIGWWVFDEIVKFNEAGLEWRNREVYSTSKYAKDLETIAAAEEKYSDCTCMESRNGFMYHSKELHKLDRDTLERVLRIRETHPA
ncbi:capsid protein [Escherichia phage vB_ESM-pEJ01]|nr:capsid protein [Escherichia phage vB_ESM-pEJ01]